MGAAAIRVTAKEDEKASMDPQALFYGVLSFLPAITRLLCNRGLGAAEPPFRPVMGARGEAGAATDTAPRGAGAAARGATPVTASASETPSRWARAVRERAGAAPRARSAASRGGTSSCIH